MIKRTKRPKKAMVKVQAAAAEAMEPVPVKVVAPYRMILEPERPAVLAQAESARATARN